MSLHKINPTETKAWKKLIEQKHNLSTETLNSLFSKESNRLNYLSIKWDCFDVDFSKNILNEKTFNLLAELAEECKISDSIKMLFDGDKINETEGRSVLHTELRNFKTSNSSIVADREKIKSFSSKIIDGTIKGCTGKKFTDVVNIGIGGSDLGPKMAVEALKFYKNSLNIHFISNVDGDHNEEVLKTLNPETTFFIVVSKTFTTQETLTNANLAKNWIQKKLDTKEIQNHFCAISTNIDAVKDFGINEDYIFKMYDFVGGRFSMWGSVGLSISISIGYDNFKKFLIGAEKMDTHFKESPIEKNIPICLALIGIWNSNFLGSHTQGIIPYTEYLNLLPNYLQQSMMESNGKNIDRSGKKINYSTGNIIWGGTGTNTQHAFFQLIHQGDKLIPCDFIGFKNSLHGNKDSHNKLMSNYVGQMQALMRGRSLNEVVSEMESKNMDEETINKNANFKVFDGNKPTTSILIDQLNPESLGMLISMYEHIVFTKGVIWNIFSFDQWGVELGKVLASKLLTEIEGGEIGNHDHSTESHLKKLKNIS